MFRGDWSAVTKAGLSLVFIVILATAVFFISKGMELQRAYQKEASSASQNYTNRAAQHMKLDCAQADPADRHKCTKEIREADRENRRKEYDLEAQRITAAWTSLMGGAALVGMAFSIIGVALVWTTFHETKIGNVIAREIGEAQTRAYLSITDASCHVPKRELTAFRFDLRNAGNSPARKTMVYLEYAVVIGGEIVATHKPNRRVESPNDWAHFGIDIASQGTHLYNE